MFSPPEHAIGEGLFPSLWRLVYLSLALHEKEIVFEFTRQRLGTVLHGGKAAAAIRPVFCEGGNDQESVGF